MDILEVINAITGIYSLVGGLKSRMRNEEEIITDPTDMNGTRE